MFAALGHGRLRRRRRAVVGVLRLRLGVRSSARCRERRRASAARSHVTCSRSSTTPSCSGSSTSPSPRRRWSPIPRTRSHGPGRAALGFGVAFFLAGFLLARYRIVRTVGRERAVAAGADPRRWSSCCASLPAVALFAHRHGDRGDARSWSSGSATTRGDRARLLAATLDAASPLQGSAAVGEQRRPVDVRRLIREKPGDERGDLLRPPETARPGSRRQAPRPDRPASSRTVSPSIVPGATAFTVTPAGASAAAARRVRARRPAFEVA